MCLNYDIAASCKGIYHLICIHNYLLIYNRAELTDRPETIQLKQTSGAEA